MLAIFRFLRNLLCHIDIFLLAGQLETKTISFEIGVIFETFLFFRLDLEVEPIFASMALYDGRVKKKVWFLLRVVIIRFIIWILEKILDFKYLEKTKDERWLNLTPSCLGGGRGGKGESWFCHGLETGVGCKLQLYLFLSGLSLELGQVTFLAGAYLCQFLSYGTTGSFPTSSGWDA